MAQEIQNSSGIPTVMRQASTAMAPSTSNLTPKDALLILRRHVWLVILLTFLGFIFGGAAWYLLLRYHPQYTASTYIKVLSPAEKDPTTIGGLMVSKDIQYGYRSSIANLIKQQNTLNQLIDRAKVQETSWFQNFGEIKDKRIKKALRNLNKKFGVSAQRDGEFIVLSMTCEKKDEAALIVNEMVDLFLDLQGATKRSEIASKLSKLEEQRVRLVRDLKAAEDSIEDVRTRWQITDLEVSNFRDTISVKLDNLNVERDKLIQDVEQLKASIQTLEKQATGPVNEQIENQIERDPTMVMLAQQLASQEAALAGLLTRFGENHNVVRQTKEVIQETRERRLVRQQEIAEQTRQSNLKNAQDQLVQLAHRLEQLNALQQETAQKKRDYDLARVQYEQRLVIKDEREQRLNEVKEQNNSSEEEDHD